MSSADDERDRIDLRAEPELVARLKRQAKRLGISMSAYIRLAVTRQVEQDESNDPKSHRRK
jgi:predicted HicB family RNase H-like nuclease